MDVFFSRVKKSILVIIITSLAGCATMEPLSPYDSKLDQTVAMRKISDGVEVTITPFNDKDKIEKYFGTNLI